MQIGINHGLSVYSQIALTTPARPPLPSPWPSQKHNHRNLLRVQQPTTASLNHLLISHQACEHQVQTVYPPGMFVQHVYDSPSVVDAAVADVKRERGKRLEHAVPLGSNLDDLIFRGDGEKRGRSHMGRRRLWVWGFGERWKFKKRV